MNPTDVCAARFPRVSGDEPGGIWNAVKGGLSSRVSGDEPGRAHATTRRRLFSPRERG